MKNKIILFLSIGILFSIFILSGCKNNDPDTEEYIIYIDSIVHPDTINLGDDLNIKFYGVIGENGCYEFDRFIPVYTAGELSITTYGLHTFSDMCTEAIVMLNGQILMVSDIAAGNFTIKAIQSEDSTIVHTVFVKE